MRKSFGRQQMPITASHASQPPYSITFYSEDNLPLFTYHVSRYSSAIEQHRINLNNATTFSISIHNSNPLQSPDHNQQQQDRQYLFPPAQPPRPVSRCTNISNNSINPWFQNNSSETGKPLLESPPTQPSLLSHPLSAALSSSSSSSASRTQSLSEQSKFLSYNNQSERSMCSMSKIRQQHQQPDFRSSSGADWPSIDSSNNIVGNADDSNDDASSFSRYFNIGKRNDTWSNDNSIPKPSSDFTDNSSHNTITNSNNTLSQKTNKPSGGAPPSTSSNASISASYSLWSTSHANMLNNNISKNDITSLDNIDAVGSQLTSTTTTPPDEKRKKQITNQLLLPEKKL